MKFNFDPLDPFWKAKFMSNLAEENPIGCLLVGVLIAAFVATLLILEYFS